MTGDELRTYRKEKLNMTSEQLGSALGGVHANSVTRWERGEIDFPPYLELAIKYLVAIREPKRRRSNAAPGEVVNDATGEVIAKPSGRVPVQVRKEGTVNAK